MMLRCKKKIDCNINVVVRYNGDGILGVVYGEEATGGGIRRERFDKYASARTVEVFII